YKSFIKNTKISLDKVENDSIREIIAKMIAYDRDERYANCSEIIADINKKLSENFPLETDETREAYVLGAGFVGREKELSQLTSWLDSEEIKVLLIHGEAGIGKSRLFEEFKHYCQLHGIEFFQGDGNDQIRKPFSLFLPILNQIIAFTDDGLIEKYAPQLKKLLPDHVCFDGIEIAIRQDPKTEQGILIQNVTNFLIDYANSQKGKIALYLDSIQWSDDASIETLEELMYKLQDLPDFENLAGLRVYTSSREEGLEKFVKLRAKNRLEEMQLYPFDEQNVQTYMEAVFGVEKIDDSLKKEIPAINKKVGGNPYFLEQLIKSLVEKGLIQRQAKNWMLLESI
ncbi:MAG TPA: ATP-binding protein, partial [Candidatus Cloacimonetes bacterium]|nr:ATP-binding protein [Candidatus Cloacimonadota bacterium]